MRQKIFKMNLEHIAVLKKMDVLTHTHTQNPQFNSRIIKGTQGQMQEFLVTKAGKLNNKINNVVLGYNPKYIINSSEFILM